MLSNFLLCTSNCLMCTCGNFEDFRLKPLKFCIHICQEAWETSKKRPFYFLFWGFWGFIADIYLSSQLLHRQNCGYKFSEKTSLFSPPSPYKQGQGRQDTLTFHFLFDRFFSKPSHFTDHIGFKSPSYRQGSPAFTDPISGLLFPVWPLKFLCSSKFWASR